VETRIQIPTRFVDSPVGGFSSTEAVRVCMVSPRFVHQGDAGLCRC
jgi:hypothetical protein